MSEPPSRLPATRPCGETRVFTLGRFRIELDGVEHAPGTRGQRKPLELLKLLVALGARSVHETQLSDSLWPRADGFRAHRSFITNLHRLRKLIGRDALLLEGSRLTLAAGRCWVDALALPGLLQEAALAADAEDGERAWSTMQDALDLYHGPFLSGEFAPAELLSARKRLHSQFLTAVLAVADGCLRGRRYQPAISLLSTVLQIDDLAEPLYARLVRAHLAQGWRAEAIEAYERCRRSLAAKLGCEPSGELERLRSSLLGNQGEPIAPQTFGLPHRLAAGGERRSVTVALSRISGPAGAMPPEELDRAMSRMRHAAAEVARRWGGALRLGVSSDLQMLFGVPAANDDDAVRAVRAACELHERLRHPAAEPLPRSRAAFVARTAISTGVVMMQPSGAGESAVVTGAPVVTSAELLEQARADEILISAETRRRVAPYFDIQARENQAYQVLRTSAVRNHFEAAQARGLTPFVGRAAELAQLRARLHRTLRGEGQQVWVSGEAGIGKSRLLHEFIAEVRRTQALVIQGHCEAQGRARPFWPFSQALREALGYPRHGAASASESEAVARLRAIDRELERYLPVYLHLLSLSVERDRLAALAKGEELRRVMREALAALFAQASRRRPLVLVLEDWHWVDEESREATPRVLGLLPAHPLMVVLTSRPEGPPLECVGDSCRLRLASLKLQQSEAFIRGALGAERMPQGLHRILYHRTAGNPFFMEEICNALVEERAVVVSEGRVGLTRPLADMRLPGTVQDVIRSRIDRLAPELVQVLGAAAVVGREFEAQLLATVGDSTMPLARALEVLVGQDLLQQTRVVPHAQYRFKHVLTQEVVYDALPLEGRKALHEQIGRAIEVLHGAQLEEYFEALARHFDRSGNRSKALHYLELAADKASRSQAVAPAREHYRRAIDLLDAAESSGEVMRRRIDINLKWAAVSYYASLEEQLSVLAASLKYAQRLQDPVRLVRVKYWTGRVHHILGNTRTALGLLEEVIRTADPARDAGVLAMALASVGRACTLSMEFERGISHLTRGVALMQPDCDPEEPAYSTSFLGLIHACMGQFPRALSLQRQALMLTRRSRNLTYESATLFRLGLSEAIRGNWRAAVAACDRSIRLADRVGNRMLTGFGLSQKGYALFMQGDRERGIALAQEGIDTLERCGTRLAFSLFLAQLAEAFALSGDGRRAIAMARKSLAFDKLGERLGHCAAMRALALAEACKARPDWDAAEAHVEQSLRLAESVGAGPDMAVGWLRLAELRLRSGRRRAAKPCLSRAAKRFRSMRMTWWLAQARALLSDPSPRRLAMTRQKAR